MYRYKQNNFTLVICKWFCINSNVNLIPTQLKHFQVFITEIIFADVYACTEIILPALYRLEKPGKETLTLNGYYCPYKRKYTSFME